MAQWATIQQYPQATRQIQSIYSSQFPIEVRHFLAQWIEDQPWMSIETDNPQHESVASTLLEQLVMNLSNKVQEFEGDQFFPIRLKLQEATATFKQNYEQNPFQLVRVIKNCLQMEKNLIEQAKAPEQKVESTPMVPSVSAQIEVKLEEQVQRTQASEQTLKHLQSEQESFIIQYQDSLKITAQITQLQSPHQTQEIVAKEAMLRKEKEKVEQQLSQKAQELLQHRITIALYYNSTLMGLQELQKQVLDTELIQWKRQQQQAGNGAPLNEGLETLQKWCEQLADLIWQNRQQIKKVNLLRAQLPIDLPPGTKNLLPELNDSITGLLSSLVTSTFIVETQPPQVLKKDARFAATVRLLVGGKLNVHMNPPQVKATIISEKQAQDLLKSDVKAKGEMSGEILNNVGTMEYQSSSGQLSITFRNMQLKKIKRADRKGTEAVTEEKFCILFQSDFNVGGNELVFQVWTLSLPVVVTVHGNQECNALATILWDNAFSSPGRNPFEVPESVLWPLLAEQLNVKFKAATGRGLTDDNIKYLASKILGQSDDYTNMSVSWVHFNKEALPGRNFTFWEWFYAVLKLTKEHLKSPWNDGSIIGFISKFQAQEWLLTKTNGTFLLRYSDSEMGGITIAWVADNGKLEVWNLAPFTSKDFSIRGLADRIKDLSNLAYLYPDIPKNQAFSKYYVSNPEQPSSSIDGYIKPTLVNVIPVPYGAPMNYDNPQTPQLMSPLSPATTIYDRSPGSVHSTQQNVEEMTTDANQIHLDDFLMGDMDYNYPDDFGQINVNELLTNSNLAAT
ncbi:signal transducer and activator of transcription 5A-like [Haliotis rufescens]|uniref:signal transducer and activator of transcription 5A-like n=1 Tax=Haliotis rufescens TaxID=6454 RepID=UPI00201ED158|nr:signal transducer and activator of transcription 5A-like [Haliotis rufescens]